MSSPEPGGPPRPLRVAGLALLGVAAVAAVAGLVTVFGDNNGSAAAPTSPSVTTTQPSTTGTGQPPPTSAPASTPTQPAPPTTGQPAPPTVQPTQNVTAVPVRVYNNSNIAGLATRAAEDFRRAGWRVDEISNYAAGIIPTSTVYFRPGTLEVEASRALGNRFDLRIEPRFPGIAGANPGLIVIVTNDYGAK